MQRILVIDDDDLSREVLVMLLEAEGYEAHSAASGDEALANPITPDLILTDMQMPGLCGNPLAALLRTLHPIARLIAMSGSEVPLGHRDLYDTFLLKPFTIADLEAATEPGAPHLAPEMGVSTESEEFTILDKTIYTKLQTAMTPPQVTAMFAFCLEDASKRIARMAEAVAAGDDVIYRREAHTIKGGCGMLGALQLKQIAGTMEDEGIRGDVTEFGTLRAQFVTAAERLRRILKSQAR
jgi:CheY-like chemotaxis protein